MSLNVDSMHAIRDKVCLLMLTAYSNQRQSVSVNADSMHAIKDKVCLLMLTSCYQRQSVSVNADIMLSKAKCVC